MIRSTTHTLSFLNPGKAAELRLLLQEYRRMMQLIVDSLWEGHFQGFQVGTSSLDLPSLMPSSWLKTHLAPFTWASARLQQCAAKQALAIVNGTLEKQRKRFYILKKHMKEGKDVKHLQRKISNSHPRKPSCESAHMELDSRFVDFRETRHGHFDAFVRLSSLGDRKKILLPFKEHKQSLRWLKAGQRKASIRISENKIVCFYDVPEAKTSGTSVVGADQGLTTVLTLSDTQATGKDPHGHDLSSILAKMSRKKPGSKGFKRAEEHRKNYINWSLNQLNFSHIKEVRFEKVKHLRKGKRTSKFLKHWTYTLIKRKVESLSELEGFKFVEVDNRFRSQRCNKCGWVCKSSRKGKEFRCKSCGYTQDADLNAALNLKIDLSEIPIWVQSSQLNRKGFQWTSSGLYDENHERIVRDTKRKRTS